MTRPLLAILALVLIALPATANGQEQQTNAPPGNSAIDEYLETVPAASGNQRPRAGGAATTLTKTERARLEQRGRDGKALADAVDATAPAAATRRPDVRPPAAEGRAPLSEVLDAATGRGDGGGMGLLLPAILLATLVGVITVVVLRRRSVS